MSNYATKTNLKGATGIDTSNLALKWNLAEVNSWSRWYIYIYVNKLKTVLADLSSLSNLLEENRIW